MRPGILRHSGRLVRFHRPWFERLEDRITPATLLGVTDTNLISFDSAAPSTLIIDKPITGLQTGEHVIAIDCRNSDGVLFGATDKNRLVTINTDTAAATLVGSFTLPQGATRLFTLDFDPTVGGAGSLRAITDFDDNLRISPTTGAVTNVDTFVEYVAGDPSFNTFPYFVTGAAYSNNVAGATKTTLFGIDTVLKTLVRIGDVDGAPNSPNSGQLHTIGSLGVGNIDDVSGFDIGPDGTAFAALHDAGNASKLYIVDLNTGAAAGTSPIGTSLKVNDIAVAIAPTITISIDNVSVTEGNSGTTTATFTVSLSQASTNVVGVNFNTSNATAAAGSDYVANSGTLTFGIGQTTKTIIVTINGDTQVEFDEAFLVTLSGATNADIDAVHGNGTGNILNDDSAGPSVSVSIADVTVTEGNSGTKTATFTATLSSSSAGTVTVNFATANGTATAGSDYVATAGTLTFTPGQTTRTIAVTINGDTTVENDETFVVNLSSPSGAVIADGQATGTITNDDSPTISIADVIVTEGNSGTTTATFTVSLSSSSTGTVTVNFATADGTATVADSDYIATTGTLTFAPGQTTQSISVTINGDTAVESDETFVVNLSNTSGATLADGQGTGTITNDDAAPPPTISIEDVTVTEGTGGTTNAVFTVRLSGAASSRVTVNFATGNGTATEPGDYTRTTGTVFINAGNVAQTISVPIVADADVEPSETFVVTLSNPSGATLADDSATATIVNDDLRTQFDAFSGTGGVFVATGDVDADGTDDVIVGSGPGAPSEVKICSGATGDELIAFTPFAPAI